MQHKPAWRASQIADDLIGERLQTISILTREIEKKLGESLGINLTDLAAMEQLITSTRLTPSELAARLDVTTAASTQIVDRLERVGHVSRERQLEDRRKVLVVPNATSVTRVFQELAPMLNGLDTVVTALSDTDRKVIEQFLGNVIDVYRVAIAATEAQELSSQRQTSAK